MNPRLNLAALPFNRLALVLGIALNAVTPSLHAQSVATWLEPADALDAVSYDTSGYPPLGGDGSQIEGSGAFHLSHPDGLSNEVITLSPTFQPTADTQLMFESRLRYAATGQVALVEVSSNGGADWQTLWSRTGTGDSGQLAYERIALPLGAFAGQSLRIRFAYEFAGGSYYKGSSATLGWWIDDIQVGTQYQITPALHSIGDPSPVEQELLELINRARSDAAAEAERLATDTDPEVLNALTYFNVDLDLMRSQFATLPQALPPLAFNAKLQDAAHLHSQDMLINEFQGHTSSNGDTLGDRLEAQTYAFQGARENVYAYGKYPWQIHAAFQIDWGTGVGGMQDPPGHRIAIHHADSTEVGIGVIEDSRGAVGPMVVTQDFALPKDPQPMLTGVAWFDANADGRYNAGEGLSGITVAVDDARFYAVTTQSGGFAIPVFQDGNYTVRFSSTQFAAFTTTATVSGRANVKVDYPRHALPNTPAPVRILKATNLQSVLRIEFVSEFPNPRVQSAPAPAGPWSDRPDLIPASANPHAYWIDLPISTTTFYRIAANL